MRLEDFNYILPENLIATEPATPRDSARLLVLDKQSGEVEHRHFYDLLDYLEKGDVLVLNNSRVIPARILVNRLTDDGAATGGKGEVFLCSRREELSDGQGDVWQCLVKGRIHVGSLFAADNLTMMAIADNNDGTWNIRFNLTGSDFMAAVQKVGQVPLPPYIEKRRKELGNPKLEASDENEYQTVFANIAKAGSVAAPTAGLHFTEVLLDKIRAKGVQIVEVTLHVGLGTFLPVKVEDVSTHKMHAEWAEVSAETIGKIQQAKDNGSRIFAVGTTSTRTLEACFSYLEENPGDRQQSFAAWVDIFIYPGYRWKVVDGLITNFHLPKSTLLMLVSALAGKEHIDQAYAEAIAQKYRFYSYGDAMLIL